jgi:23S rRNA pseudouridine1911/1915/1917 synthase
LAVVKPAGLATMGVSNCKPSLFLLAKDYIKRRYNKPGNVYLGVMSRLDALVTGVVLFARTSKAAARLTEQFRTHTVEKTYWAVVEGQLEPAEGSFTDYLGKDESHHRMRIVGAGLPGAKLANLTYRRLSNGLKGTVPFSPTMPTNAFASVPARYPRKSGQSPEIRDRATIEGWSLVEIILQTGRKHQIRLQFTHHGHPVVGDRKYGSRQNFPLGIALHARRLVIIHPVKGERIALEAPLPDAWYRWGVSQPS